MDFFVFSRYNINMEYLFLCISVLSGTAKSAFSKILSPHTADPRTFGIINALLSFAAGCLVLLLGIRPQTASLYTVLLGTLFGICTAAAQYFYMQAFTAGTVSVVTFIYSCGFLLPTAAGTLFWNETLSPSLLSGVFLLLSAFFLCAAGKSTARTANRRRRGGGYGLAFLAMLFSGLLGILQKLHQTSGHRAEVTGFLGCAFLVSSLLSLCISRIPVTSPAARTPLPAKVIALSLLSGLFIGAANTVNLRLSGILPAAICFPVTNGGVVVLSAIAGRVLFRERLSKAAYAGIALGLIAILMIGLAK